MNGEDKLRYPLAQFNDAVDAQDLRREWEEWHRAFELIMQLREMESQREKLATMLAMGGRGLQRIFYNLRAVPDEFYPEPVKVPLMPREVPEYDNAVKRLQAFFVGKRNDRVELEVFRGLRQKPEESFNAFILGLRTQAARCEFRDREDTEILQQITIGARDEKVRDKGLESVMNLDELINYAINREILVRQREKERSQSEVNNISVRRNTWRPQRYEHSFTKRTTPFRPDFRRGAARIQRGEQCWRCGSYNHGSESLECLARGAICNRCGQSGHYARKCDGTHSLPSSKKPAVRGRNEANSLVDSKEHWKAEIPHRPTTEDIAKVE